MSLSDKHSGRNATGGERNILSLTVIFKQKHLHFLMSYVVSKQEE